MASVLARNLHNRRAVWNFRLLVLLDTVFDVLKLNFDDLTVIMPQNCGICYRHIIAGFCSIGISESIGLCVAECTSAFATNLSEANKQFYSRFAYRDSTRRPLC